MSKASDNDAVTSRSNADGQGNQSENIKEGIEDIFSADPAGTGTASNAKTADAGHDSDRSSGSSNGAGAKAPTLDNLKEQLAKAEEKATNHWNELLRAKAELENARRRAERDVENAHKYATERLIQELIPVIDSMEMGLNAAKEQSGSLEKFTEGAELTLKMLLDCIQKFGIEVVNPAGETFNPEFHQAMSMQESAEHKSNTVINVMQKGYTLQGRLVRPALVIVSKAPVAAKEPESSQNSVSDVTKLDEKA